MNISKQQLATLFFLTITAIYLAYLYWAPIQPGPFILLAGLYSVTQIVATLSAWLPVKRKDTAKNKASSDTLDKVLSIGLNAAQGVLTFLTPVAAFLLGIALFIKTPFSPLFSKISSIFNISLFMIIGLIQLSQFIHESIKKRQCQLNAVITSASTMIALSVLLILQIVMAQHAWAVTALSVSIVTLVVLFTLFTLLWEDKTPTLAGTHLEAETCQALNTVSVEHTSVTKPMPTLSNNTQKSEKFTQT